MRVELIYAPGCNSYKKLLDKLETVIAEERLPIPVHVIESPSGTSEYKPNPTIRIDGDEINALTAEQQSPGCQLHHGELSSAALPCIESLRDILHKRWKALTEMPLLGS